MEYETINKETPEMKELISGIKEVSKRIREDDFLAVSFFFLAMNK